MKAVFSVDDRTVTVTMSIAEWLEIPVDTECLTIQESESLRELLTLLNSPEGLWNG